MITLARRVDDRVKDVHVDARTLRVELKDGRAIVVPLTWYPRLARASRQQRANWRISSSGHGIHWPDIDEDLSIEGLLRGAPAPRARSSKTRRRKAARR